MYNLDMKKKRLYSMNGDWYLEWIATFLSNKRLRKALNENKHTISKTGESYRVINHWNEKGLLLRQEGRGNGWRKFSYVDLMWLSVIQELRRFGLSLETIKAVKQSLFHRGKNKTESTLFFESFIPLIPHGEDILLIVLPDGQAELCTDIDYHNSQTITPIPSSHIVISFNQLYGKLKNKPELANKNKILLEPSEKDIDIQWALIAEKDLKEIKIYAEKGKMKRVNYIKKVQNPKKALEYISQTLKEDGRKELLIKQEDGKIVLLERTDKE